MPGYSLESFNLPLTSAASAASVRRTVPALTYRGGPMIRDASAYGSVTGRTRPERGCEVRLRRGDRNDHVVLAVLCFPLLDVGRGCFPRTLWTQFLYRGRVVVDLSEATVESDPVVQVFTAALADAGGAGRWPAWCWRGRTRSRPGSCRGGARGS